MPKSNEVCYTTPDINIEIEMKLVYGYMAKIVLVGQKFIQDFHPILQKNLNDLFGQPNKFSKKRSLLYTYCASQSL